MPVSYRCGSIYQLLFTNNLNFNIMTTQAIDATIFASSHPDIAKRTSVSGLIFSCIMLLAGVIAFVSTFEMEDRSSTISMGLMVLGTALFLIGVSGCSGNPRRLFTCRRAVLLKSKVSF